jgi:uncharacterized protein (DUF58 family)
MDWSPTPRAALLLGTAALTALILPVPLAAILMVAVVAATAVDIAQTRAEPVLTRRVPRVVARASETDLTIEAAHPGGAALRCRQPSTPDLRIHPQEADAGLVARLVGTRRGRHELPRPAVRVQGPLGLGRWHRRAGEGHEIVVYPDLPGARRIARAVREGRFTESARLRRGQLGLGTDFESVRDYQPDDDIRKVNWRATERLGRPMSNQYRLEQERSVVVAVDAGRLMAAPVAGGTRLDWAIDAAIAVAAVADEVGDNCGTVAFDSDIIRRVAPRRKGARHVLDALFDLEPRSVDADYERAFRAVGGSKRSLVLLLTDILEESAARPLVQAMPVIARRHAVVVASVRDPDLDAILLREPRSPVDLAEMTVALSVLEARERVVAQLQHAGAEVVEATPKALPEACAAAYLRAKSRARV